MAKKKEKKDFIEVDVFDEQTEAETITIRLRIGKKKRVTATITSGSFCIYANVRENDDEEKFISYPSWKDKNGEYHSYCYCFDKNTIQNITDAIENAIEENPAFFEKAKF